MNVEGMSTKSIVIGTPCYGGVAPGFARSLARTLRDPAIDWITLTNCSDVTLARNTLVAEFLASPADVLVWIDSDEAWEPSDLAAVVAPIETGAAHVVTAFVTRKNIGPPAYCVDFFPEDLDTELGYVGDVHAIREHRYVRVRHAGCGFLAMTREALVKASVHVPSYRPWDGMAVTRIEGERHAWLFASQIVDDRYQSEDHVGCQAFRAAGFEIWGSLDARVSHLGGHFRFGGGTPDVTGFAKRMAMSVRTIVRENP